MFPFEKWTQEKPHRIFLYTENKNYSYQEFHQWVQQGASFFYALNLPFLRCVLLSNPTPVEIALVLAIWRVNGCVLILPNDLTQREMEKVFKIYQPNCVLTDTVPFKHYPIVSNEFVFLIKDVFQTSVISELPFFQLDKQPNNPCLMILTSGTTGTPKLVKHSWVNLMMHSELSEKHLKITASDCWLLSLPLYHIGGIASVLKSLYSGISLAFGLPFSVALTKKLFEVAPITRMSFVPTMLQDLLDEYPEFLEKQFTSLLLGGGFIPKALVERDPRILATYGLSEAASQVATVPLNAETSIRYTCGVPLPSIKIQIRNERNEILSANEEGEIWVQTPATALGYEGDDENTQRTFQGGWIKTNDLGYLNERGALVVVSRKNHQILTGGKKVDAREVELTLLEHPQVQDVVVVPAPSHRWGYEVCAAIVLKQNLKKPVETLQSFLKERLSAYKIPKQWLFLAELPKLSNGKIDRQKIQTFFVKRFH